MFFFLQDESTNELYANPVEFEEEFLLVHCLIVPYLVENVYAKNSTSKIIDMKNNSAEKEACDDTCAPHTASCREIFFVCALLVDLNSQAPPFTICSCILSQQRHTHYQQY